MADADYTLGDVIECARRAVDECSSGDQTYHPMMRPYVVWLLTISSLRQWNVSGLSVSSVSSPARRNQTSGIPLSSSG